MKFDDVATASRVTPLRYVADIQTGVTLSGVGDSDQPEWPYLRVANVQAGYLDLSNITTLRLDSRSARAAMLRPGDVLMTEGGDIDKLGRGAIWRGEIEPILHQNHVFAVRPSKRLDSEFLALWLDTSAARDYFYTTAKKTTNLASTNKSIVGRLPIMLPPIEVQRQVVARVTVDIAQIDALIAKQKQLIEILQERRQAVLDTEFEALGSTRLQLRRGIRFLTSGSRGWADYYAEVGERFLRIGNLSRASLTLRGHVQYVQLPAGITEGSRTRLRRDDLLFSITAYLGSVAVVTDEWIGAYVSQHVALCRLDPSMFVSQFVGYFMLTTEGQDQLNLGAAGGTKLQLALDDIKALSVPLAPLGFQRNLVASIEVKVSKIDALIAKAEEFIALARERRAALITEAVTGKIDVSTGKVREGA